MLFTAIMIYIQNVNSRFCFQTLTCHCRAKPENLCYSSMCMVPPTQHLTTEDPADKCLLALAILAEPFPERKIAT